VFREYIEIVQQPDQGTERQCCEHDTKGVQRLPGCDPENAPADQQQHANHEVRSPEVACGYRLTNPVEG